MMTASPSLAVCSWSLRPGNAADLARAVGAAGLDAVQLALDPLRTGSMPIDVLSPQLHDAGIRIESGMMAMAGEDYSTLASIRRTGGLVPDATWPANLAAAHENARIARALGLDLVSFHAGFVPHGSEDPVHATLLERLRAVAAAFAAQGVSVALETGQETAQTMLELVETLADVRVGVNFDPANMILYGMGDPVAALRTLAPHVRQVHIKDARPSAVPGEWGVEVPVGQGDVDWAAFFAVLNAHDVRVPLVIERESGEQRIADMRAAKALVERELSQP